MNKFVQAVIVSAVASLLMGLMIRTSGRALIPLMFVFAIVLSYVAYTIIRGKETPYPRIATGVFEREEDDPINLSATDTCESCSDEEGAGKRMTTYKELVFLGVPLAMLGQSENVLCDVCADPLAASEEMDSIDRELAREKELEAETE
jgi:hypothetical protein